MAPLYVGGCVRALAARGDAGAARAEADSGILAASGLVAGEGLAGVLVAFLVAFGIAPRSMAPQLGGFIGEVGAFVLALAICAFLYRAATTRYLDEPA
jgi:purine-cytosine permease-like protein